jgi:hypothetical protein
MHVLPLPFGLRLAVAILPRRDADLLRGADRAPVVRPVGTFGPQDVRARILEDPRFAELQRVV